MAAMLELAQCLHMGALPPRSQAIIALQSTQRDPMEPVHGLQKSDEFLPVQRGGDTENKKTWR